MLKQVKDIFKEDALGRLRMISWLHDFEKIENNIYKLKQEIALENNRQKQTTPNPSENKNKLGEEKKSEKISDIVYDQYQYVDPDALVRDCFFPIVSCSFSLRENPLKI